jgi:hypothetical protein
MEHVRSMHRRYRNHWEESLDSLQKKWMSNSKKKPESYFCRILLLCSSILHKDSMSFIFEPFLYVNMHHCLDRKYGLEYHVQQYHQDGKLWHILLMVDIVTFLPKYAISVFLIVLILSQKVWPIYASKWEDVMKEKRRIWYKI